MAQISSNSLFHFTDTVKSLKSILINGFFPRYCLEDWRDILSDRLNYAFPMVCFCDIPLSQTRLHTQQYGGYALGMSKEWGEINKINPVLYTYRGSATASHVTNAIKKLIDVSNALSDLIVVAGLTEEDADIESVYLLKIVEHLSYLRNELQDDVYSIAKYLKPYQGRFWIKQSKRFSRKKINYYNEREWRFIPESLYPQAINEREYSDKDELDRHNKNANKYKLEFSSNDIKYIIVAQENEIPKIADYIFNKFKGKYTYKELMLMVSKILSIDQVIADM